MNIDYLKSAKYMRINIPEDEMVIDLLENYLGIDIAAFEKQEEKIIKMQHSPECKIPGYRDVISYYEDANKYEYTEPNTGKKRRMLAEIHRCHIGISSLEKKIYSFQMWICPNFRTDLKQKAKYYLLKEKYCSTDPVYDGYTVYLTSSIEQLPIYYGYVLDILKFLFKYDINKYCIENAKKPF